MRGTRPGTLLLPAGHVTLRCVTSPSLVSVSPIDLIPSPFQVFNSTSSERVPFSQHALDEAFLSCRPEGSTKVPLGILERHVVVAVNERGKEVMVGMDKVAVRTNNASCQHSGGHAGNAYFPRLWPKASPSALANDAALRSRPRTARPGQHQERAASRE